MNVLTFKPPPDRVKAEKELRDDIKAVVYEYAGTLTVVQVVGILEIAKQEILGEQQ